MILKQIPRHLLIHNITYEEYIEEGSFGSKYKAPELIRFVLYQPEYELVRDSNGEEVLTKGNIYIDSKNSDPPKMLREKSKIDFNGIKLVVNSCAPVYAFDGDKPHHYKVTVV